MKHNDTSVEQDQLAQPSVDPVSKPSEKRSGRTYSFTVPALPRPNVPKPAHQHVRYGLCAFVFILLAFISGFGGAALENHNSLGAIGTGLSNQKKIVTNQSQLISQIAKTVGPSVVSVNVNITSQSTGTSGGFFGFSQPNQEQAAGTGIIISSKGLILTNRHVVPTGTTTVSITLSDGTELKDVSVLGRTNDNDTLDVAFLKVNNLDGHKLSPATIGDSGTVQVGDDVVAIGNALGQFQNTVTSGIISGYGRSVQAGSSGGNGTAAGDTENLDNLFQTDAAINEGNSGGPLVNLNGQIICINTAIAGNAQNVGFSIPINDVRGLISQVLKTGKFARPYLGIRYIPLTSDIANGYSLKVQNGAYIAPAVDAAAPSILVGGPADSAGLQERDIIIEIDGNKVDQTHSLTSLLDQHLPGDKVDITFVRGSDTQHVNATLGEVPKAGN